MKIYFVSILIVIYTVGFAKTKLEVKKLPDWIDFDYRNDKFPSNSFFIEFAKHENIRNRDRKEAEEKLINNVVKLYT
jgi:hypothetical protein